MMKRTIAMMMVLAMTAGFASAQDATSDSVLKTRVDFSVKEADLIQSLEVLAKNTGLKYTIKPGTEAFRKVSLYLPDEEAGTVLQYVCQAAGARVVRDDNGVFVIYGPGAEMQAVKAMTKPVAVNTDIIRRIRIMHADPAHVMNMMRDVPSEVDSSAPSSFVDRRSNPTFRDASTANGFTKREVDAGYFQRQGGSVGGGQDGGGGGFGGGGGQDGGFGGGQGQGGGQGGGGSFSSLRGGQGLVPQGVTRMMYDPTDNSLIFQGSQEAYRQVMALLALFDQAPKQVIVKFEFVTLTKQKNTSLGIDWLYERSGVFFGNQPGQFARSTDQIFFNWASGNVSSRLRTQLIGGQGTSVTAPMVRTLNNQPGFVSFNTAITIFQSTTSQNAGTTVTTTSATTRNIQSTVSVRPRINGDGTITMGVSPFLSTLGQLRRGPDGQEVPDVITQSAGVIARVKNGESIAIGGLSQKSNTGTYSRFPLLSDLPIIGQLFRTRTENINDNELVIFVTPRIVEADETGLGSG